MKNEEESAKYPHLLDNHPCGEDLFKGKSHETIANQIEKLLKSENAPYTIGIEGEWGSGKSNLVSILKKKMATKDYHIFIYDAWGHQDDLQRRSILEELTTFLTDKKHQVLAGKWNERRKDLIAKKQETTTKNIPRLSVGIIVSFLVLVLTPVFSIISENFTEIRSKVLFSLIPFGFLILSIIIILVVNLCRNKNNSFKTIVCDSLSEAFQIYSKDKLEYKTIESICEEEPSSIQFKKWLHDIDDDLQPQHLILVFDNMDRLPQVKVQELWAAIHSFFADETYKNISVIVPFDREHIRTAFSNEDEKRENAKEGEQIKYYGDDFINKTFDVVYRVSPPIMSDWKSYFELQWKKAFGDDYKLDENITQIYDLLSNDKANTPRNITAFINHFVTIKQISGDKIPDKYIALYIFGEDRIRQNPFEQLIQPKYLGGLQFMYENDEDLPKYTAALYYQLDPTISIQAVYLDKLRKALDTNSVDDIKKISELPSFYDLLENAITKVTNISNTVMALNECGIEISTRHWDCVYKKVTTTDTLQDYQKILITKITSKEEYLQKMIDNFYNANNFSAIDFYESIAELSRIDNINPYRYLKDKEVEPSMYLEFVGYVGNKDFTRYKIICDFNKLDDYLNTLEIDKIRELIAMPYILTICKDFPLYKSHLYELFNNNFTEIDILSICIERLKELFDGDDKDELITINLNPQQWQNLYNACPIDNSFRNDLIAIRMAKFNNLQAGSSAQIFMSDDMGMVELVAERLEYYVDLNEILLNLSKFPNIKFLKAVASYIIKVQPKESRIDLAKILAHYSDIIQNISVEPSEFIVFLNKWEASELSKEDIKAIPVKFFEDGTNINNGLMKYSRKKYINVLNNVTTDDWLLHIQKEDKEYQLLEFLGIEKIQSAFDAFKKLLVDYATGENQILSTDKRNYLLEIFKNKGHQFKAAFNNVSDVFVSKGEQMTLSLFKYFADLLLEYATLDDKKTLRTIFKPEFLDDTECINIILKHKEKVKKIYENAGDENADFKDKMQILVENKYKDNSDFVEFAESIGITKRNFIEKGIDKLKEKL